MSSDGHQPNADFENLENSSLSVTTAENVTTESSVQNTKEKASLEVALKEKRTKKQNQKYKKGNCYLFFFISGSFPLIVIGPNGRFTLL